MVSRTRSRLSSSAVCNDSLHSDLPSRLGSLKDRPEARRRLGRNGQVFLDLESSNSDSEECSETDMQLLPLADGYTRRVTFSTGGAPPEQQQQQQQQQSDPAQLAVPNGARLWRGAAASVCAGQRLQSLERHAAELKARQEVHTELKAWVEAVLTDSCRLQQQQDDPALDGDLPDPLTDEELGEPSSNHLQQQQQHRSHHHHRHHRTRHGADAQQQQQEEEQQQQQGDATAPRRHSHRHRRHHRHHHAGAAEGGAAAATAAEADAGQTGSRESEQQQELPQQLMLVPTEGTPAQAAQWQQFNAAEQQLIAQMQQDQQLLLEQLQQAYQHITALTAQQATAAAATPTAAAEQGAAGQHSNSLGGPGVLEGQPTQADGDEMLQPGPHTQVLVIHRSSDSEPVRATHQAAAGMDPAPPAASSHEQQQQPNDARGLEDAPAACQAEDPPAAVARCSSSSNTPRARLTSRASTAQQSDAASGRRTPRAAAGKAQKTPASTAASKPNSTAADKPQPSSPRTPRKSLQAAQAAAAKPRPSLQVPTGRGLTLPQQQALVQRLQQAEEVMDLLQQDLQESLEAQQQLQEQVQLLQEAGPVGSSAVGHSQTQLDGGSEQGTGQQQGSQAVLSMEGQHGDERKSEDEGAGAAGQLGQPDSQCAFDTGVKGAEDQVGSEAGASALQQLQEDLQEQQQQLAAAQEDAAGQQQLIAELQQELESRLKQEQQQVATISSLSEQLAIAAEQLQAMQLQLLQHNSAVSNQHIPSMQEQHPEQPATAAEGPMCCQHEARCQQLQTVLQALLRQLQVHDSQASTHLLRPQTAAAAQGSPRIRASWQHRPVELHTWLCPGPPQQPRPITPRLAQPPQPFPAASAQAARPVQAAAQQFPRSASVPRCSTATVSTSSSTSPRLWARMAAAGGSPRCNTSGPLSSRCFTGLQHWQDSGNSALQPLEYKLRPLTYRGPDRAAADAIAAGMGGRRQLSVDAQKGLLSSLRVAPVSARSHGQGALQQQEQSDRVACRGASCEAAVGDQPYADVVQAGDAVRYSQELQGTGAAVGSSLQLSPRRQHAAQQGRSPRGGRGQGAAGVLLESRRGGVPRLVLTDLH